MYLLLFLPSLLLSFYLIQKNREIKDKLFEKQLELQLLKGLSTTNNTQDFKLEEEEEEVQEYEGVIHKNGG